MTHFYKNGHTKTIVIKRGTTFFKYDKEDTLYRVARNDITVKIDCEWRFYLSDGMHFLFNPHGTK